MQATLFGGALPPPQVKHAGSSKAPPAAPPVYVIEVITGNKRENKSFPGSQP
jgi:hypothetical protein